MERSTTEPREAEHQKSVDQEKTTVRVVPPNRQLNLS
jgi:hypothetical protein